MAPTARREGKEGDLRQSPRQYPGGGKKEREGGSLLLSRETEGEFNQDKGTA